MKEVMNILTGTAQVGMQLQISVPAQTIVDNSTNCNYDQIMLLFHDSSPKTSTVEALPAIIENYKNRGYVFKAISDDTPIFHHGVNN